MWSRGRSWRWSAGLVLISIGLTACWLAGMAGGTALAAKSARLFPILTTPTPTTSASTTTPEQVQIAVGSSSTSEPLPAGFLGFSIETEALHEYLGRSPESLNPVFIKLLEGIDQNHAPVLRIGGDSTDDSWVQIPGVIPPLAVNYVLTNDWVQTVHALVQATGARLILGVNLAADDPQIASVEARTLVDGIGRQYIEALEIGNEPDLYLSYPWYALSDGTVYTRRVGGYDFQNYIQDLNHWREIMPSGVPLAAGALAELTWLPGVLSAVTTDPDVSMVTMHRYPLSACETDKSAADYASLTNLLDSASTEGLAANLSSATAALHEQGRQLRIDELNSASCEGAPGVSNTFGSALWILNVLFDLADANVDGVNLHTLPTADYAPFSFTHTHGRWSGTVNPVYYGMLMFASAFPTGAELLSSTDSSPDVKSYTTEAPDGKLRTTIINENPNVAANITLQLPANVTGVTEETLTAPSLASTSGVELGDQAFADPTTTGRIAAPDLSTLTGAGGSFTLSVPPDSAVLLTAT